VQVKLLNTPQVKSGCWVKDLWVKSWVSTLDPVPTLQYSTWECSLFTKHRNKTNKNKHVFTTWTQCTYAY